MVLILSQYLFELNWNFFIFLIYLISFVIISVPQEIAIIKKESFNNWYKLKTFYLATLITSTPVHVCILEFLIILEIDFIYFIPLKLQIISSSIYITITYLMTDQPLEFERYVKMILTGMMVTICADGLGIFLGTILNPVVS